MFVVDQQTGDICHQFALLKTYIKQLPSTARKSNLHNLHGENMYCIWLTAALNWETTYFTLNKEMKKPYYTLYIRP